MDRLDNDAESEYLVPMTINIVTSPDYFDFAELIGEFIEDPRTMLRLTNSVVDKCNEVVDREVSDMREDVRQSWQQNLDAAEGPVTVTRFAKENLEQPRDWRDGLDLLDALLDDCAQGGDEHDHAAVRVWAVRAVVRGIRAHEDATDQSINQTLYEDALVDDEPWARVVDPPSPPYQPYA